MIIEEACGGEQMGVGGIFGLDGGEEGGFEEELLATCDEMVFWRGLGLREERIGVGRRTWLALPHVSQDLDVACDLFL